MASSGASTETMQWGCTRCKSSAQPQVTPATRAHAGLRVYERADLLQASSTKYSPLDETATV
ncbi:hypothetical protein PF003_g33495 [Phytophthora fragariae]|nr:hypothetical protein PF003_g33495 [Phytophthora fragariae]